MQCSTSKWQQARNCVLYSLLVLLTIPASRAAIYMYSIIASSNNYSCLERESNASRPHPRPTDIFLHGEFASDVFEKGNELIYFSARVLLCIVLFVFGHGIYKHPSALTKAIAATKNCSCTLLVVFVVSSVYLSAGCAVTAMEIKDLVDVFHHTHEREFYSSCNLSVSEVYFSLLTHHILGFPFHTLEALILLSMLLSCAAIQETWRAAEKIIQATPWPYTNYNHQYSVTIDKCFYNKICEELKEPFKLYQTWFVLQWISYFLVATADFIFAMRLILNNKYSSFEKEEFIITLIYILLYFAYETASFLIPYICGALMNKAHNHFYETMQENAKKMAISAWASEIPIEKNPKCDFVPKIFYINIDIPISSPGYLISVLFDVFVLMCTLVTSGPYFWK